MNLFKDLIFKQHPNLPGNVHAKGFFTNGYGVSVVTGGYGSETAPYELAIIDYNGRVVYDTPITDDVIGHLTEEAANDIMVQVFKLPKREGE